MSFGTGIPEPHRQVYDGLKIVAYLILVPVIFSGLLSGARVGDVVFSGSNTKQ